MAQGHQVHIFHILHFANIFFTSLRLYQCVRVCVCVYTHTHIYIYIYIHIHTHTHTHTYIYIYIPIFKGLYTLFLTVFPPQMLMFLYFHDFVYIISLHACISLYAFWRSCKWQLAIHNAVYTINASVWKCWIFKLDNAGTPLFSCK